MKTFLALEVLPFFVAANQPCDLSGILEKQANGKFDFGDYKLKFAKGRVYDDLKLSNKGQMKKTKAEFHHKKAGDSSDAWVVCNKTGHKAQYYLSCSADGVLTVGPSKDSTGVSLPDCSNWDAATKTPICDRNGLGPFTTDVAPCRKDNCYRYCGDEMNGKTRRTFKKIKCNCDWASNTCTYQHKPKGSPGFVDFDPEAETEYSNCDVDPTDPAPTTTDPPPTAEWSEWGAYSVCSAACGDGTKSRSRTCSIEGECEGPSTETTACNEGDCVGLEPGQYCIFPSYGQWLSKKIQGTQVEIGMNCPEGTIDNGDHVLVLKGVTCHLDCAADDGRGFRIESSQVRQKGTITCRKPIPKANLAEFGCDNGQCDTDFIAKGPNKANWDNNLIPAAFDEQQHGLSSGFFQWMIKQDLSAQFEDADLMKCYPNIDDGCDPTGLETAEDFSWDCPNDHGSGAVCTKVCNNDKDLRKSERTCECKSTCQWKGAVSSCT